MIGEKGYFYIKGVIHITNIVENKVDFEVIEEDFFYTGLEKDGCFLSQSDVNIYLEDGLKSTSWDIEVKVDEYYAVLGKFDIVEYDGYYESYEEVQIEDLKFSKIPKEYHCYFDDEKDTV